MQTPFIRKLQNILEDEEYVNVIAWNHSKTIIEILDEEKFQKEVLPAHFRHAKMTSFIRQLNLYGFRKLRATSKQSYTHSVLENGQPLLEIKCLKKNYEKNLRNEPEQSPRVENQRCQANENREITERKQQNILVSSRNNMEGGEIQNNGGYSIVYMSPEMNEWYYSQQVLALQISSYSNYSFFII